MPDFASAAIARDQHGVLSRSQALTAGLSRDGIHWRLTTGRWERVHPTVFRVAGAPPSWEQNLMAACLHAGPEAGVSHRAAAALWRLDGMEAAVVEITTPRRIRRPGVIAHLSRLSRRHVTSIGSIPVTDAARTLLDLGAVVPARLVEQALDDALRRGLVTLSRLHRRLAADSGRGRAGAGVLRRLLASRGADAAPPESVLEARLARLLSRHRLPDPIAQHEVRASGRLIARVDFAWPEQMVALEADGYRYHSGRAAWQRDLARRNALTRLGWRVLHVTWDDLARPETVISALRTALQPFS